MATQNLGKVVGDSAYEVAVSQGYVGTESEWLASLVGPAGEDGAAGADGFSPLASVTKTGSVATIEITDSVGTTTASVMDGANGAPGADGFSPIASVVKTGTVATITITDSLGTTTASIYDGSGATLVAGSGISINGNTISNTAPYSDDAVLDLIDDKFGMGYEWEELETGTLSDAGSDAGGRGYYSYNEELIDPAYDGIIRVYLPNSQETYILDEKVESEGYVGWRSSTNWDNRVGQNYIGGAFDSGFISVASTGSFVLNDQVTVPLNSDFIPEDVWNAIDDKWDEPAIGTGLTYGIDPISGDTTLAVDTSSTGVAMKSELPSPDGVTLTASNNVWSASIPTVSVVQTVTQGTEIGSVNGTSLYAPTFTESDPIFAASAAATITASDISTWNSIVGVPTATASDEGKALVVTDSSGSIGWGEVGGGSSYTAGTGINITNDVISVNDKILRVIKPSGSYEISIFGNWSEKAKTEVAYCLNHGIPHVLAVGSNSAYTYYYCIYSRVQNTFNRYAYYIEKYNYSNRSRMLEVKFNADTVSAVSASFIPDLPATTSVNNGDILSTDSSGILSWVAPPTPDGTTITASGNVWSAVGGGSVSDPISFESPHEEGEQYVCAEFGSSGILIYNIDNNGGTAGGVQLNSNGEIILSGADDNGLAIYADFEDVPFINMDMQPLKVASGGLLMTDDNSGDLYRIGIRDGSLYCEPYYEPEPDPEEPDPEEEPEEE